MHQKGLLKNFPHLDPQDWTLITKNDVLFIANNYTADQFVYQKMNFNSRQFVDIYKARSLYAIPNTPQIILPHVQGDGLTMEFFVQFSSTNIQKVVKKNLCWGAIQQILKVALKTIEYLVKKYGFFKITNQMIKVSRSNNLLIWPHENFNAIHRRFPLESKNIYQDYKIMINDLLTIFQQAGCQKLLKNIRSRIQNQKIITFQKFKIIIESQLRCTNKSKDKQIRVFQSPQFLRNRLSPESNKRATTQQFYQLAPVEQTRFATTVNIGSKSPLSSDVNSRKNSSTMLINNVIEQKGMQLLEVSKKQYGIRINMQGKNQTPKSQKSFAYSQNLGKNTCSSVLIGKQVVDGKKKDVRQSGNSLATTAFINSMTSSGKLKLTQFEQNLSSSSWQNQKGLASSVGVKQTRKIRDLKQTFKVKESKIIEQKNQQISTPNAQQSIIIMKRQKDGDEINQSQVQRQFNSLLKSNASSEFNQKSSNLLDLQNEVNNILFN